jgi:predicted alpha-1,2-mannosidase
VAVGSAGAAPQPADEALPLVGTGGHGHTYPGATVPFGFVQVSPDTRTEGWDACSGYHYSDNTILGFSHTHLSGTGCPDLGDLLILPVTGKLEGSLEAKRFRTGFSHEQETAQPGYYQVYLDKAGVEVELTATAHCAMHRYTFKEADAASGMHLLFDLVHGLASKPLEASLKVEGTNRVTGYRRSGGWANGKTVYFVIESSEPFSGFGLETEGSRAEFPADHPMEAKGKNVRGHLDYANLPVRSRRGPQVMLRVGLSPVSLEGAIRNLQTEIGSKDFNTVRADARTAWNDYLSSITVESSDHNLRETFYSALYHISAWTARFTNIPASITTPPFRCGIHSAPSTR